MSSSLSFGTDGWRAVISEDFTFENVRAVAQAIADYACSQKKFLKRRAHPLAGRRFSLVVGYDTRFLSERYAQLVAEVLAGNGIPVVLSAASSPTPSVSFAIRQGRHLGGVMITASHNPAPYNGIKYKGHFGGSVGTEATDFMESRLFKGRVRRIDLAQGRSRRLIQVRDIVRPHLRHLVRYVDMKRLAGARMRVLIDSMNGTGAGHLAAILAGTSLSVTAINTERDTYFGGRPPEPNEVHLAATGAIVRKGRFDVGLATDGDADRLGVIAPDGTVLSGHKVMTLLLLHLLQDRAMRGGIVQTICGTALIDRIAREYGLATFETPVGFKYIAQIIEKEDILLGGEETGGVAFKGWLPERDGILSALLILQMMALRRASLTDIVKGIEKKYGTFVYKRYDCKVSLERKRQVIASLRARPFSSVLGRPVADVRSYDGFKFIRDDGSWLMLRASGTEPKFRVYSEAHSEAEALGLISFGKQFVMGKR